jgi:general secretion pathway protein D
MCLLLSAGWAAGGPKEADRLFKEARKAERAGDIVRAYLLYCRATGEDPSNTVYWLRSKSLEARAGLAVKQPGRWPALAETAEEVPKAETSSITELELAEARQAQPPLELKAKAQRQDLDLRGNARALFEQTARAYGLEVVFDGEYQPGSAFHFQLTNAGYQEALHALEAATGSFIVPLGERLFLVAKDTAPKRAELEPTISLAFPVPPPVSTQEAQELTRSVQQALNLTRLAFDSTRRIVLMRDRISKIRPAAYLLQQLLRYPAQVAVEVEFLELSTTNSSHYGASLQTQFPLIDFGSFWHSKPVAPTGFTRFLAFGGGDSFLGVGITDASAFATMDRSALHTLLSTAVRSLNNQPANLHVGQKYPIIAAGFLGQVQGQQSGFPPTVNFEDLGLVLKVTPHVHETEEVSLDLEAEFKVLTGQSRNGIPVISNRKFQSSVRLKEGQWAVVAGLMVGSATKSISGPAGLSLIPFLGPLLRSNTLESEADNVLLILKPRLLNPPPGEEPSFSVWVGSETRAVTPL